MILTSVVPCSSSGLANNSKIMSMFVPFSWLFWAFEDVAFFEIEWTNLTSEQSNKKFLVKFSHGWSIDDYAKDGGPGEVWLLCSFDHESFCTWIKTIANKFAISNHTALILGVHALRSYLKLICEHELHSLPNKKVGGVKDHGKNYIKVRPPLVRHLLGNRVLKYNFRKSAASSTKKWGQTWQ